MCLDCHEAIADDVNQLRGLHGRLENLQSKSLPDGSANDESRSQCRGCHTDHKGRDFDIAAFDRDHFDHAGTDFELTGAHQPLACTSCHEEGAARREAPSNCLGCHEKNDAHEGNLGEVCSDCHGTEAWRETAFDHNETAFKLTNAHSDTACQSCHLDKRFTEIESTCVSCHAISDIHQGKNGDACDGCHDSKEWKTTRFDHNVDTEYLLEGAHAKVQCSSCHGDRPLDEPLNTRCRSCHTKDDVHMATLGPRCESCHSPDRWADGTFDHSTTEFALKGTHETLSCAACHQVYESAIDVQVQCNDCHSNDDPHEGGLGNDCSACHAQSDWQEQIKFNHDLTAFPLSGGHQEVDCGSCHVDGEYRAIEVECQSCHDIDSPHSKLYPAECNQCHNANAWMLVYFDHETATDFPLTGAHADVSCGACHGREGEASASETASTCFDCHREDDPHRRAFGRECEKCHVTESFKTIRIWEERK